MLVSPYAHAATLVITDKDVGMVPPTRQIEKREAEVQSGVKPLPGQDLSRRKAAEHQKSRICTSGQAGEEAGLSVQTGDLLSQRITEWAQGHGYTVSWEAPEFRAGGNLILNKALDETLTEFKRAMEMNGVHLDIITYDNCVVRIVEVQ